MPETFKQIHVFWGIVNVKDSLASRSLAILFEFVSKDGWLCKKYIGSKEIKDIYISKNIAAIVYKDRIDIITF